MNARSTLHDTFATKIFVFESLIFCALFGGLSTVFPVDFSFILSSLFFTAAFVFTLLIMLNYSRNVLIPMGIRAFFWLAVIFAGSFITSFFAAAA